MLPGGLCGEGAGGSRALVVLVRGSRTPGGRSPTLQLPSEVLLPRARGITAGSPDLSAVLEEAAPPPTNPTSIAEEGAEQSRAVKWAQLGKIHRPRKVLLLLGESLGVQGTPARLHIESPPAQSRAVWDLKVFPLLNESGLYPGSGSGTELPCKELSESAQSSSW